MHNTSHFVGKICSVLPKRKALIVIKMNSNLKKEMELGSTDQSQQRKVIHFSSGETLEEDDSEEETAEEPHQCPFNKAGGDNLSWRRYAWFWGTQVMIKSLQTCDFVGGKLASLLGLTLAKYQYAIDEYQLVQKAFN
ncbi:protein FAM177A1 isoform X2 [Colossoma macropomum]|uniref:protein FAM177A1 isoform X2 n=1 Tax=Colossoma macropomum TaxID=42526 RepID=UPI001864A31F|nr:protein FAM177A1 isoform X2 [Colossoma macropomum]